MTAIDLSRFAPEVALLGATTIVGPLTAVSSTPVTGFSDVATATIVVEVERVDNSNGEALSVTVQQSDDGNSWTTAAGPYSFTRDGTQTLAVDSPADRLRVTYSAARGVREATIGSVTARLGVVDAPGGGGAQSVEQAQVTLLSADILALADTPKVLVPGVAGVIYLPMVINVTPGAGTAYTVPDVINLFSDANDFNGGDVVQFALTSGFQAVKGLDPTKLINSADNPGDGGRGSGLYLQVQEGSNPTDGTLDAIVTLLYASLTDTT